MAAVTGGQCGLQSGQRNPDTEQDEEELPRGRCIASETQKPTQTQPRCQEETSVDTAACKLYWLMQDEYSRSKRVLTCAAPPSLSPERRLGCSLSCQLSAIKKMGH